ncbi:unnamed protein product [Ectocarpus sp. 8 AP-2014]|uniref:Uncharacterized protein n=1 Tax=Ectocarpus siliculosus TaxID=2880 RepID=D8LQ43_ECTSI|nr:expressed unknown protein [Ectocarpus siliculosus]|eukprot:CBN77423.1 expressed unknown protein [Ectocarpus siliculosus]
MVERVLATPSYVWRRMVVTWPAINRGLQQRRCPTNDFQALRQGGCQWLPTSAR